MVGVAEMVERHLEGIPATLPSSVSCLAERVSI
jgi:hypothetical protein